MQTICHGTRHKTRDKCYISHGNGWRVMSVQDRAQRASPPNAFVAASRARTHLVSRGPIWSNLIICRHDDCHTSHNIGQWSNIFTCFSTDCLVPVTLLLGSNIMIKSLAFTYDIWGTLHYRLKESIGYWFMPTKSKVRSRFSLKIEIIFVSSQYSILWQRHDPDLWTKKSNK